MRIILVCICAERENAKLCDGSVTVKQAPSNMGRAAHRVPPGSCVGNDETRMLLNECYELNVRVLGKARRVHA